MQSLDRFKPFLLAVFILTAVLFPPFAHADDEEDDVVPGYVLVRLKDGTNINDVINAINRDGDDDDDDDDEDDDDERNDTTLIERIPGTNWYVLETPSISDEDHFVARLAAVAEVQSVEKDRFLADPASLPFGRAPAVYTDQYIADNFPLQASLEQIVQVGAASTEYVQQSAYAQIGLTTAAESLATGAGIKVAVLDTGVNPLHPALYGRCAPGFNALNPFLPPRDVADGVFNDAVGHGTHVAGLIRRLAPKAQIIPVRVMDGDGVGSGLSLIKGLHYAVGAGARVVNISVSSGTRSRALEEVVASAVNKGVVIVASAGNVGPTLARWPAACTGVLAVASVDSTNHLSTFSSWGLYVSVCAPGEAINGPYYTGGYTSWSGTSFATPLVAGQAALILSRNPTQTGATVRSRIRTTTKSVAAQNPYLRYVMGSGLIQIEASLRATPR